MTRTPFDAFTKQVLEELLTPLGTVEVSQEVPGESRLIDVRFIPAAQPNTDPAELGLLGRLATAPWLIEPFRNPPDRTEIRNCLLKLFGNAIDLLFLACKSVEIDENPQPMPTHGFRTRSLPRL